MSFKPISPSLALAAVLLPGFVIAAAAQKDAAPPAKIDFVRDVQPILQARCLGCHGSDARGGLRLDEKDAAFRGGASGPVILPGKSAESLLIHRVLGQDSKARMPRGGAALSDAEVTTLRYWIDEGAPWPDAAAVVQSDNSVPTVLPAAAVSSGTPANSAGVDFVRDILPVFRAQCMDCHDSQASQGGLRLDRKELAFRGGKSGLAIVPGNSRASLLVSRIQGLGGKKRMPLGFRPLPADDIQRIITWIDAGAPWPANATGARPWAFIPPKRPALPAVHLKGWANNPIDTFVLARLEQLNLKPSPPADRATLIRRVFLDITGVPPIPSEVDTFLADRSPNAYEKVVDRLLASPRYGERMAMDWLDGARYADSNGFQADWERYQWRWRDWVIDAFNHNMPFDQFTIDQIAGDLEPNPTLEQKIATGFNRNHRINTEGGVIPEEWRVENVVDRVDATSQVWMGVTMGCARCHDHKYDPISQKDYYRFFAFFNNVPESGTGEERPVNHPPIISAPTPVQTQRLAQIEARQKELDALLAARAAANATTAEDWTPETSVHASSTLLDGIVARYALSEHPTVTVGTAPLPVLSGDVKADPGHATGAVTTAGGSYVDLGAAGDFDTRDSFSYGGWINPDKGEGSPLSRMDSKADFRGWDLFLTGGRLAVHLINKWPTNALKVITKPTIPNGEWTHVLLTYDGSAKPDGIKIYFNGKSVAFDVETNALTDTIRTTVSTKIGTRTGTDAFSGKVDDVVLYHRVITPAEAPLLANDDPVTGLLSIAPGKRTSDQKQQIARIWSERHDREYQRRASERDSLAKEREQVAGEITTVMVMDEMPKPRDCFILERGQYDKHGAKVDAAIPAVFGVLPPGAAPNRLGLAQWIVSPFNPLTARVTVNRLWERYFGAGIVRTTEDFGTRGERPTHPHLLDWLATELVRKKWNLKAIQREIVLSATYRQSSNISPALLARDPENRLLARGPRFRLPAELIRDQALAASGLLAEKIGGPSVRPYQPEGIWDETSVYGNLHNYKHDKGDGLYRRSLYTIWKRTAAPPEMTLFDAPTREICRVRRSRTNTPLQALVLLNDETYVEAARVLAQKMLTEGGKTPGERITYAFRRVLCRRPTAHELGILTAGTSMRLVNYHADIGAAKRLDAVGDTAMPTGIDPAELGAYTLTASIILNMDEAITRT